MVEWFDELRPLVEQGRAYKDAVAELFAINSELLALWRRQQSAKSKAVRRARKAKTAKTTRKGKTAKTADRR